MLKQIAVVEDNSELVDFIKEFLTEQGDFRVDGYLTGTKALRSIKLNRPDLVLIDLQLQDIRGETLCVEFRKLYNDLPIIILTGDKSQESIIKCLNSGADDYITKPFNAAELLARIKARLRAGNNGPASTVLSCGDITMNLETLEVYRGEEKIDLTAKEFELLKYLLINKSRVLTRDKILNAVWGYTTDVDTRVVDVHIGKVRRKIEKQNHKVIESIRGFGYKVVE